MLFTSSATTSCQSTFPVPWPNGIPPTLMSSSSKVPTPEMLLIGPLITPERAP